MVPTRLNKSHSFKFFLIYGPFLASFWLFSSFLQLFKQLRDNMFVIKFCRWLDSNRENLVLDAPLCQLSHNHCPSFKVRYWVIFINCAVPGIFFLYFRDFNTFYSSRKICWWRFELRTTTLPTEPQPLPYYQQTTWGLSTDNLFMNLKYHLK